uniref:Uncharacterized protein n=1 Tax=Chromera velia CCMP2878 TaxID=1169474 RepID=A0A0G4F8B1_9ALVE|eukprot:Cvel_15752.t1-p1 / transcript=Cvel_15752.t1 / gene=Cvel_15752 / organism=Chromera_velia_CCMP2878 / gene_product=hypothetical protein / transcript_product=hypothetical protein / location=Cvel_scaffold1179:47436-50596(+) / protein_length=593 / sequence_SO=supercontig / SO=protein_coding / is_pseudo=false
MFFCALPFIRTLLVILVSSLTAFAVPGRGLAFTRRRFSFPGAFLSPAKVAATGVKKDQRVGGRQPAAVSSVALDLDEGGRMSNIRVISFDLDDTLWVCEKVMQRANQKYTAFVDTEYPLVGEWVRSSEHKTFAQLMRYVWSLAQKEDPSLKTPVDFTKLRKDTLRLAAQSAGLEAEKIDNFVEEAFSEWFLWRNSVSGFTTGRPEEELIMETLKETEGGENGVRGGNHTQTDSQSVGGKRDQNGFGESNDVSGKAAEGDAALIACLRSLRQSGFVVGAVTNGNSCPNTLDIPFLKEAFDFWVNAAMCGCSKPDPRVFRQATREVLSLHESGGVRGGAVRVSEEQAEALRECAETADGALPSIAPSSTAPPCEGAEKGTCDGGKKAPEGFALDFWLHVGDDIRNDCEAAKVLGMRTVWTTGVRNGRELPRREWTPLLPARMHGCVDSAVPPSSSSSGEKEGEEEEGDELIELPQTGSAWAVRAGVSEAKWSEGPSPNAGGKDRESGGDGSPPASQTSPPITKKESVIPFDKEKSLPVHAVRAVDAEVHSVIDLPRLLSRWREEETNGVKMNGETLSLHSTVTGGTDSDGKRKGG